MCGLCGIMRLGDASIDPTGELMDRMTDCLTHRGPNDRGTWCTPDIELGHRRLSVIDLSKAGRQPMSNEDGSVQIVYNGEMYNFRELEATFGLRARGHRFRSHTDTEVLIHLFEELGPEMAQHLNGMFALAIWDARSQTLHLARDPYGVKPLFYHTDGKFFRFASEIKALLTDSRVPRRISPQALHDYLTFNYVPGVQTAFQDIWEVPPGHWMTIHKSSGTTLKRFWEVSYVADPSIDLPGAVRRAGELIDQAVERQLVADVPVGVMLSGGLDSSAIVAMMARHTTEPIHTFSIGFPDASFDERPHARIVAEAFNTIHHEVVITADRVRQLLPSYLGHIDEPYADGSAIPTYYVCELAADDVVVVLSGEGADEAFAGYETHAAYRAAGWARRIPGWIRDGMLAPLVQRLPVSHRKLSLEFRLKRFIGGLNLPPAEAHLWWRIVMTEQSKHALYTDALADHGVLQPSVRHFTDGFAQGEASDDLARLLRLDANIFLPDDLMIKNDRMSMAHSLEARVPFTDPDLTTFMARVPSEIKLPGLRKKAIMRAALQGVLPRSIIQRKKVGLEMPYSRWLRKELSPIVTDYLSAERLDATGLFRPTAVQRLVREHQDGRVDHGRTIWGLINYMMWLELYGPTL